ncbi:MAG: diacylglycerol kinase family lipid kinase [Acidobacteria bacterium]|nr:diacylglycerol kinase family lipid kinase [Acidobacteriota bacterium]
MVLYRQGVLIYNPAAGWRRGRLEQQVQRAVDVLRFHVERMVIRPTVGPRSAIELARQASEQGADLVLACGGDGTINEVVNGLAHAAVPLAVLPAGTANVLAREIGLPRDPVRAAEMLASLAPRRISLGRVSPSGAAARYFLLLCGAGLDAHIVYHLDLRRKARLGVLAYWWAGLAEFGRRLEVFEVEIGPHRYECAFALAAQSSTYGGSLQIARDAHLLSGEFQVVLFHSRSTLRYLRYLAGVLTGRLEGLPDVTFATARRLEMRAAESARVYIEVDGESAGCLPATLEIVPGALTLLMPAAYLQAHG